MYNSKDELGGAYRTCTILYFYTSTLLFRRVDIIQFIILAAKLCTSPDLYFIFGNFEKN